MMINVKYKIAILLASLLLFMLANSTMAQQKDTIVVNADLGTFKISKYIYGQFMEDLGHSVYGGVWVGPNSDIPNYDGIRKDVVKALRKIEVPDVRWPGGCFADDYHWKDGIGPRSKRPKRVNKWWGKVVTDNAFGTQEFLRFCRLIGAEPYMAGNVGSGTPHEMEQWVEYLTYPGDSKLANLRARNGHPAPYHIKFWGVGNESWGCGGSMTPEYYANLYKRYATFLPNYDGNHLFLVASGPNGGDYHWTRVMMQKVGWRMDGLSMHYYTSAGRAHRLNNPSTNFSEKYYFYGLKSALNIKELIERQSSIMDEYDPDKNIALVVDEWGIWNDPLPGTNPSFLHQQNSLRDALIASMTLDIFNKHADRVKMANIAQMVNVLQAMILTKGPKMVLTPTYYVFKMYKVHQGATYLPINIQADKYKFKGESIPSISATASKDSTGVIHVTLSNFDPHNKHEITIDFRGIPLHEINNGSILTANQFDAVNTFEKPDNVMIKPFDGAELSEDGNKVVIQMPSKSIVSLTMK